MGATVEQGEFSQRDYIAPSCYLRADRYISNWNYYSTFEDCRDKDLYLRNQGGRNVPAAGNIAFVNNQRAQTLGINVDFWILQGGLWMLTSYKHIRSIISSMPPCIMRMYTPQGNGPYFSIFNNNYFGLSAAVLTDYDPSKIQALDSFYREVQLAKYRFNEFVGFLNYLAKKPILTQVEAKIYNQGLTMLQSFQREMLTIKNIDIGWSQGAKIGALPILAIIAIVAVLAGAAGWTVQQIISEKEKTKRINDAYQMNQWVADKKIEVGQLAESGQISSSDAANINKTLDKAAETANNVAVQSTKNEKGLFGEIGDIVKWAAVGLVGYMLVKNAGTKST